MAHESIAFICEGVTIFMLSAESFLIVNYIAIETARHFLRFRLNFLFIKYAVQFLKFFSSQEIMKVGINIGIFFRQ